MSDDREPIVDALLEELLGDVRPPDLTRHILDAHDAASDTSVDIQLGVKSANRDDLVLPRVRVSNANRFVSKKKAVSRSKWQGWVSAAIVLVAASMFAVWAVKFRDSQIAKNLPPKIAKVHSADAEGVGRPETLGSVGEDQPEASSPAESPQPRENGLVAEMSPKIESHTWILPPPFQRSVELQQPTGDERIVASVNRQLKETWEDNSITAMGRVSDFAWLGRASQFLIGRKPSAQELQVFARERNRDDAIERLIARDEFSQHWADVLADILVGSSRSKKRFNREQLKEYLARSITVDMPYDQLAYELITAVGSTDQGDDNYNPATNFLLAHQSVEQVNGKRDASKKIGATDKVCQVFLGRQMQCAQCHDHPSGRLTQDQYFQMAAFFAQMRPIWPAGDDEYSRLINGDFGGTDGEFGVADLFFTRPDERGVSAYPRFLDGREPKSKSGLVREVDRRTELARMIVSSDEFSPAFINRLWDLALGSGFTQPVDDMGSHNPPSHSDLLARLAKEFKNTTYDMKSALRWITMSEAFDRKERSLRDRLAGQPDMFSSFARRGGTPDRAIGQSLNMVAAAREKAGDTFDRVEFFAQLATGESMTADQKQVQMQRINGRLREKLLSREEGGLLSRIARNEKMTDHQRVTHLFLATVGRQPRQFELRKGVEILKHGSLITALQDLGWVLLSSAEYDTQH